MDDDVPCMTSDEAKNAPKKGKKASLTATQVSGLGLPPLTVA